jgi:hypothetical protein
MISTHRNLILNAALCAALLGACVATVPHLPDTTLELRAPVNQMLAFDTYATGVQVYECSADAKADGGFAWSFKGPEAVLYDHAGRTVGRHYGGPTWEGPDGSKVVGEVKAQSPSRSPGAIPLLLLQAKATSGDGKFAAVRSIQRLDTEGGRAPAGGCSKETLTKVLRVPYKATYYFYFAAG